MKIYELLEGRQPMRYVAGRDFDLVKGTEYKGYVLGAEDNGDQDTRKSTYAVYKHVGSTDSTHFNRTFTNHEYIRVHSVVDPNTGGTHSPYTRGMDIGPMFHYTVDMLRSGKLQPEHNAVDPAEGPEGDDVPPQARPGQPMDDINQPVLNEKFQPMIGNDFDAPSLKDLRYVWIKKSPTSDWEFFRQQSSAEEARAVAKRLQISTRARVAVGSETNPVQDANGRPIESTYTRGGQSSYTPTPDVADYPNSAAGAIQFLRSTGKYNTAGAVARPGARSGLWTVRCRDGEVQVDLNLNKASPLSETETAEKEFAVKVTLEDGSEFTKKFKAKDKQDACRKGMIWARKEHDDTGGVSCKVVNESVLKKKDSKITLKEGYEDRVKSVADKVVKYAEGNPVDKQTVMQLIDRAASITGALEYSMKNRAGSNTWKEFVKDVAKELKGKLRRGRSPEAKAASAARQAQENEALKNKLQRIASIIEDAWGQAFPDGDPSDIIIPKLRRLGIDSYDAIDWMNKAARRVMGYKSYNDFLEQSWDEFTGDNPDRVDDYGLHNNPWTVRESTLEGRYTKHLNHVWQYDRSKANGQSKISGWRKHSKANSHEEALKTANDMQSKVKSTYAVGHEDYPVVYANGKPIANFQDVNESNSTNDTTYPDTPEGAIAALGALSSHNMKGATAQPDSFMKGVWKVKHSGGACIVYLKGYGDRDTNDFEDVDHIYETAVKKKSSK